MADRKAEIVRECLRQEESCLYTSTALYHWLRSVRFWNRAFIVTPIILGGLASYGALKSQSPVIAAVLTLVAGFFPAIYDSLKLKGHADDIARQAAQFKVLQDRFRQAARIGAIGDTAALETEFNALMDRMDDARSGSLAIPAKFFTKAQAQIKGGDYSFTVDEPKAEDGPTGRAR
ncbi:hypothetical protein J2X45_002071 [Caulobacter sp. BE264]|uniref:hypothetical protein n=1 Tax=Caulobacter sp. BE264 TaxID=2817724 RepID=UPI002857CA13|nr:hypothetical protein [Caulobacter sp. BE264]MDR7230980.1 hypothetical protein [Caulobacter sp. BE264]